MKYKTSTNKKREDLSGNDYEGMIRALDSLCGRYPYIEIQTLGRSFMGRSIPLVALGKGQSSVMYIGTVLGRELVTGAALLKFIGEYCEVYSRGGRMYNNKLQDVFLERTVYVLPMLDVDGVEYAVNGIGDKKELYDKLCNGEEDFACERGALNNFIRFNDSIKTIASLRQQSKGILFSGSARALSIAKRASKMTGYRLEGMFDASHGSEALSFEGELPEIAINCGIGGSRCFEDAVFDVYSATRELLFSTPFMI